MMLSVFLRDAIVGLTFFACGLGLYLATRNFAAGRREHDFEQLGYGLARVGTVITIGLIAEAIFHAPSVPLTWRVVLYIAGLSLLSIGFILIAWGHRQRQGQGRQEP